MDKKVCEIPKLDYGILWKSEYGGMSDHVFSVSNIKYKKNGKALNGNATGFFFKYKEKLYFITNKHVVLDEDESFIPDEICLELHIDRCNLKNNRPYSVPLYDGNGEKRWLEHPDKSKDIDVIALPVELPSMYHVVPFNELDCIMGEHDNTQSIYVPIGEDVLIIGYPEGFYDTIHKTPIVNHGSLASVYPLPYQDKPQFLIEANLHKGTSGSPVLLKTSRLIKTKSGSRGIQEYPSKRYLIGIHSGHHDICYRRLNLHIVWFAETIEKIVENI